VHRAAGEGEAADTARAEVLKAFATLDESLAGTRYLLGDRVTLADVRLFVTLARYDRQANAAGRVGPRLTHWSNLWDYARDLYQQDGFRDTTRFDTFGPEIADLPDWDEPVNRSSAS
jgi:putative glutathione S-transferase